MFAHIEAQRKVPIVATKEAPSLAERMKAAGIPRQVDREFIAELGEVTWLSASPAQARNPQSGELGDGLMVEISDANGTHYTSFVGNVALLRFLADPAIEMPFVAAIQKSGRTWVFVTE